MGEFKEKYKRYCKKIETLKSQLSDRYRDPQNRDLDRALWVYGHIKCAEDVKQGLGVIRVPAFFTFWFLAVLARR